MNEEEISDGKNRPIDSFEMALPSGMKSKDDHTDSQSIPIQS
jgi:hypothetical protein